MSKSSKNDAKNLKIGPWVLGSFLGQGYAAQVREATHEKSGQKAAIKILTKDDNNEKADLLKKMREKEIIIMKLVDHPNIVRLYDVYETANHIYLVMEVLQGSLFSYVVKSVRVSPNKALVFFQQIIEALEYMHKHLICHRDLKPENFLLNSQTVLKVCDFGFASLMKGDDDMLNTRCGTLHYASPDILTEGDGYDGRLHDVWSAGVNLYVMVTGELPFNDKNPKILLRKIMTGSFEFPTQVPLPYDLKDLIFRMLTVDSKQRITIPEIKRHPWFCSKPYNVPHDVVGHINPEEPFEEIDEQIINAIVLLGVGWEVPDEFRTQLKKRGTNAEKVVYLLLLRKKLSPSKEDVFSYAEKTVQRSAAAAQGADSQNGTNGSSISSASASTPSSPPTTSTAAHSTPQASAATSTVPPISTRNETAPSSQTSQAAAPPLSARGDKSKQEEKKKKRNTKQFSSTDAKQPGTVPEQNQTAGSIDKILNWFNKDKKKKDQQTPSKADAAPTQEDGDDEEEGDDDFFDLLVRSNQKPIPKKGDLRIRGNTTTTPPDMAAIEKEHTTTPAPTPTPTPQNNHHETPSSSHQAPDEEEFTVYVSFVSKQQKNDFEKNQKAAKINSNKCRLQFKDQTGSIKPITSRTELDYAMASGFSVEYLPPNIKD